MMRRGFDECTMRFAFLGQEGVWWSLGDAGNPIDRYYNMTSRMFLLTIVLQGLMKRRKEIV